MVLPLAHVITLLQSAICDPFSRNLEQSKGMGAKGSMRTFENLLGVWVRTFVQLPPSGCMRDGSTLMLLSDTQQHGARQG